MKGDKIFAAVGLALLTVLLFASCDRQRDLYIRGVPLLQIEGDWVPSLGKTDMSGKASAVFYDNAGGMKTEFFTRPTTVDAPVKKGSWDVLIFNGSMFSERQTNLEMITFRNTSAVDTFEADVAQTDPLNNRLSRADGEVIASNGMELLTSAFAQAEVLGQTGYHVKYINGIDQHPTGTSYVDQTLLMTPRRLNWYAKVIVQLINAGNATSTCSAAVRGFVGSALMAAGTPGTNRVTHQMVLGTPMIDPSNDMGSVESPLFVTFGPPLSAGADWKYEVEVSILTRDGETTSKTFDVSEQVAPVIEQIAAHTLVNTPDNPILLIVRLDLPELEAGVELDPWDDGDNIIVPLN